MTNLKVDFIAFISTRILQCFRVFVRGILLIQSRIGEDNLGLKVGGQGRRLVLACILLSLRIQWWYLFWAHELNITKK